MLTNLLFFILGLTVAYILLSEYVKFVEYKTDYTYSGDRLYRRLINQAFKGLW